MSLARLFPAGGTPALPAAATKVVARVMAVLGDSFGDLIAREAAAGVAGLHRWASAVLWAVRAVVNSKHVPAAAEVQLAVAVLLDRAVLSGVAATPELRAELEGMVVDIRDVVRSCQGWKARG